MSKEIELKYKIESENQAEKILNDEYLLSITDEDSFSTKKMKAAYFDTEQNHLIKNNIAFRVRKEDDKTVATIKWDEENMITKGLYKRNEINRVINDDFCLIKPKIEWFLETEIYGILKNLIEGKDAIYLFEMFFQRTSFKIDYEGSIFELSYDNGKIVSDKTDKESSISELELELFHGDEDKLIEFGKIFSENYQLKPKNTTKYKDGIELLEFANSKEQN